MKLQDLWGLLESTPEGATSSPHSNRVERRSWLVDWLERPIRSIRNPFWTRSSTSKPPDVQGADPSELEDNAVNPVHGMHGRSMIGKEADLAAFGAEEEFIFNGVDGLGHQDFLQQIRRKAFKEGKTRDDAWMADLAVLHMSGEALAWFETLSDDVQKNWSNLKRAIIQKYGDGSAIDQLQPLQAANIATSRGNVENNATPPVDPLLPARIRIANWDTPALASTISFPSSERDWLNEGRQRKWKFGLNRSTVYWHLVEPSDAVPDNAISVGFESGVTFYSLRAWHEGGLTLGKIALAKRAWIIWHGREIPWRGPFEVLVGDQSAVRWIRPQVTGSFEAVEGGFEAGISKALLVARFELGNVVQPGKVFSGDFHGYYGWWNKESVQWNFQVLTWA